MPIIARKPKSDFHPAPEGSHAAVCCDVVDLGNVKTQWGTKLKVKIVWQIREEDPETKRRYTVSQRYTLSLHEKAKLREMLEAWRGKKFTPEELEGFDLEKLLGANCQVQVVHNIGDEGGVYANVQAIMQSAKGTPKLVVRDYVREIDRQEEDSSEEEFVARGGPGPWSRTADEYVPF